MAEKAVKPIYQTLAEIRGGDLVDELTQELRCLVQDVLATGKPGSLTLRLSVKNASKGSGTALLIEDDVKVKPPKPDKGTTFLFATESGELQRNDPRQPRLVETMPTGQVVPMGGQVAQG